ncbi:MAG: phosphoadenosine phosphosulfate reductase family protein [Bacillota bacterium]
MPNGKPLSKERIQELETYIHISKNIVREAYRQFDPKNIRLVWSGHKDSTLTLWIWRETCKEYGFEMPKAVTIDEGDTFEEAEEFLAKMSKEWGVVLEVAKNEDVLRACNYTLGADVWVKDLNERNREEIKRIGFGELERFPFEAESFVGNHLMKSVALNVYLEENNVKVIVQGLRWDEQPVRADDPYIEEVAAQYLQPAQVRIRPILHISERALWDIYHHFKLPFVSLYAQGYRSLGAKTTTTKMSDLPAWEQDLENTVERAGRRQDKEAAMARLRALGYM